MKEPWNGETLYKWTLNDVAVEALARGVVLPEVQQAAADMLRDPLEVLREHRDRRDTELQASRDENRRLKRRVKSA